MAADSDSEGSGSLLTSRISEEEASEEGDISMDETTDSVPTMFRSAELYLQTSGLQPNQFVPPNGRDKFSSCTLGVY